MRRTAKKHSTIGIPRQRNIGGGPHTPAAIKAPPSSSTTPTIASQTSGRIPPTLGYDDIFLSCHAPVRAQCENASDAPISYRAIVPRAGEAANLFVPVCLSASHIAYGSIRMESVFMILVQSSAMAAVLAIEPRPTSNPSITPYCGSNCSRPARFSHRRPNLRVNLQVMCSSRPTGLLWRA
jgi:hypothetical protein